MLIWHRNENTQQWKWVIEGMLISGKPFTCAVVAADEQEAQYVAMSSFGIDYITSIEKGKLIGE